MRIVLLGYGVMGRRVEALAGDAGHEVVARIDADAPPLDPGDLDAEAAIEFAGPEGAAVRIREAVACGLPVVSGSTGWDEEMDEVRAFVRERGGALLHAPNLSLGVAVFERIVRRAARLLDVVPEYRVELEETHHTRKVDHPSGTARWLADGLVERIGRLEGWDAELVRGEVEPVRRERADARDSAAPDAGSGAASRARLPVRSFREGDVPGTHVVRATGPDDVLELTHRALRRDGFARGALRAAGWLRGRRGVYTLDDMLDDLLASDPADPR